MAGLRQFAAALVWMAASVLLLAEEFPVLVSCSDPTEIKTKIKSSDPVEVHFGLAEGDQTCYSVTVGGGNARMQGYLLGKGHPAIAEFERKLRANSISIGPPPPPARPKPVAAAPPPDEKPAGPSSFAGMKGVDLDGHTINLDSLPAAKVVLYFWNPRDRRSVAAAESMEYIYQQYHSKGVDVIGVATSGNEMTLRDACSKNEVTWPQILDTSGIARRYQVESGTHFFVLDQQRNVVKAVTSGSGVEAALQSKIPRTKALRAEATP